MKKIKITEEWQREVVARDFLDASSLISRIANLLYPDMQMARDRETKLRTEGGRIISRIEAAALDEAAICRAALAAYEATAPVARSPLTR